MKTLLLVYLFLSMMTPSDSLKSLPGRRHPLLMDDQELEEYARQSREARREKTEKMLQERAAAKSAVRSSSVDTSYYVGSIPVQEGVTPTGARTYTVPIAAAPGLKLVPNIALSYNSLAGNGVAGYGWDIAGLPCISLAKKTAYYDGTMADCLHTDSTAVYALDGVRIVQRENAPGFQDYTLETASGHILVKRHSDVSGRTLYFSALYPDGGRAVFGKSDAATPDIIYPLTRLEDRDGNALEVKYRHYGGMYYPDTLRYGLRGNGQADAQMVFSYVSRNDCHVAYMGGLPFSQSLLLKSIISRADGQDLATYSLVHQLRENVNLLTEVRCSCGGSELPPVAFDYGIGTSGEGSLVPRGTATLEQAFVGTGALVRLRGKFVRDCHTDGVVTYPLYSNYVISGLATYISMYDSTQVLLCVPSLEYGLAQPLGVAAGKGFQTLQAADVDGDGTDDLVRVNYRSSSRSKTYAEATVFSTSVVQGRIALDSSTFNLPLNGSITQALFWTCPNQRHYLWGDFLGKGYVQMLAMSYDKNYRGMDQTCHAALADLKTGQVVSDEVIFNYSMADSLGVFAMDMDGDGRTELCRAVDAGLEIYEADAEGHFSLRHTASGIDKAIISSNLRPVFFTDVNADGYMDVVRSPYVGGGVWTYYCYDGAVFRESASSGIIRSQGDEYFFIDVDKDGLSDLVRVNGTVLSSALNSGGSILPMQQYSSASIVNPRGIIPCSFLDPGGMSSFIMMDGFNVREFQYNAIKPERLALTEFNDSFGNRTVGIYADASAYDDAYYPYVPIPTYVPNADSGYVVRRLPAFLLQAETKYLQGNMQKRVLDNEYQYSSAVFHMKGLGFCGFRRTVVNDILESPDGPEVETVSVFDPERRGVSVSVSTRVNGTETASSRYSYDSHSTTYGKLNPRLVRSVETDHLKGVTDTTTVSGYDGYDCPATIVSAKHIIGETGDPIKENIARTYNHSDFGGPYVLGVLKEESITRYRNTISSNTHILNRVMAHDSLWRPVSVSEAYLQRIKRASHGSIIVITYTYPLRTTLYSYDSRGNVTSESTSSYGADSLNTTTYTYDPSGRFLTGTTDPLGRTTTYSGYGIHGLPGTVTDRLGHSTTAAYDSWGNLVRTVRPDGAVETESRHWSGSGEQGLYCIARTETGSPGTRTWYDALGREVRSANRRFDGSWQFVTTEYDSRGRVYRTSLPYKDSLSGPTLWNTYSYDLYGRPASYTELFDDAQPKVSWSYSGTSTTVTEEGIATTTTTDAAGNVVSVSDPGGTITYTLRDDGQPGAVTVTPAGTGQDIVTTFAYDHYGRRTSITDPSAGTRTDAYTDNHDGTGSVAHGGPNGTVTTYYDRYGRVTSVTRPEFNTAYTYGTNPDDSSYGELLSEVSTNRTSRSFTYDSLGRVATATEHADSTEWLRKTYTYGAGSSITSIAYATQDGLVTTESYTYANGYNTGISSSVGGTGNAPLNVFTLTAENDLGIPTGVTTGGINRTYGYDFDGRPSFRRALRPGGTAVQDLGYSFSQSTGNMSSRTDRIRTPEGDVVTGESFTYDGLNRLLRAEMDVAPVNPPPPDPMNPGEDSVSYYVPGMYGRISASYDQKGNVLTRGAITAEYDGITDPYAMSSATWDGGGGWTETFAPRLEAAMTSFDRPASVADTSSLWMEPFVYARYDYSASGGKARAEFPEPRINRWYMGGEYEKELRSWGDPDDPWGVPYGTETVRRLFLGGDAYSAPMVLVKVDNGEWTPYNLGRDAQGSITHVMTADGELVERFIYDPWGGVSMLDAEGWSLDTLAMNVPWGGGIYSRVTGCHGYTGHEHIPGVSLVNANARIYDYAVGRFLSPDPLIQDPASTQNFNRYAYCLNNPLKYTDESGEFWEYVIAGLIGGIGNWYANGHEFTWKGLGYFGVGALAGIVGAGLNAGITSALAGGSFGVGSAMIAPPCFYTGYTTGLFSGLSSGVITGMGNSLMEGNNAISSFYNGIIAGMTSGFSSGVLGGVFGGLYSIANKRNFFDASGVVSEYIINSPPVNNQIEYSNENAKMISNEWFGYSPTGVTELHADNTLPANRGYTIDANGIVTNRSGKMIGGLCEYNGIGTNTYTVYLYRQVFDCEAHTVLAMGHEYAHAFFDTIGLNNVYMQHNAIYEWMSKQSYAMGYYGIQKQIVYNFNEDKLYLYHNLTYVNQMFAHFPIRY